MLNALVRRKLTRMFRLFDQDRDGALRREDYERISGNLLRVLQIPRGSTLGDEVLQWYVVEWGELQADADRDADGRVTSSVWLSYRARQLAGPDAFEVMVRPYIEVIATHLDGDGDGVITREDIWRYLSLYGMPDADREVSLARAVPPGARGVTRAELLALARQFYFSDDEATPGSWFLGPF